MRIFLLFVFFSGFILTGWWLKQGGPERWPNRNGSIQVEALNVAVVPPIVANTNTLSPVSNTTPTLPNLPSPASMSAQASGTEVNLRWDAVDDAYGYALTRNAIFVGVVYGTTFLDFALTENTAYTYTIAAVNKYNIASGNTASAQVTTPTTIASTPTTNTSPSVSPPKNTSSTKPTTTPKNTNTAPPASTNTSTQPTNTNQSTATPTNSATPTNTSAPPANTNTVVTPPTAPACGQGGSCTAAEISSHNTRANCWVYLSPINRVYNITSYVKSGNNHPGGDVIVPYCGQNMYNYFIGSAGGHRHSNQALNSILQAYYIGAFTP